MKTIKEDNRPGYEIYQAFVDEIFGHGKVRIHKDAPYNLITAKWTFPELYLDFKQNFKKRLERLKAHYEDTPSYPALLETVARIADVYWCDRAWAKLTALDVMLNNYQIQGIELNKRVKRSAAYAGKMYRNLPVKDGYLPDFDLYFDTGILGDTIGHDLNFTIATAQWESGIKCKCKVELDYPWDDPERDYMGPTGDALYDEMVDIFKLIGDDTNVSDPEGKMWFYSQVKPELKYNLAWGKYAEQVKAPKPYDPYHHAERTKDLLFKRFAGGFMRNDMFVQVLVTNPYYRNHVKDFDQMNEQYYAQLAYNTFCAHNGDGVLLKEVAPRYIGGETVEEASRHLAGIVIIDDDIDTDIYQCHVYMNPNAVHRSSFVEELYLDNLNCDRNDPGIYEGLLEFLTENEECTTNKI